MTRGNAQGVIAGNALFLILIAVALFSALAYAVTQSGRGSGSVSKEAAHLEAAQVISYAGQVQQAVQRMMLINKCSDSQISFYHASFFEPLDYNNGSAPPDESCHLFSASGGGVPWLRPPASFAAVGGTEFRFTALLSVLDIGTTPLDPGECTQVAGDGSGSELLIFTEVPESVCRAVNRISGVPDYNGDVPGSWAQTLDGQFGGSYGWNGILGNTECGVSGAPLAGKATGCYQRFGGNDYLFYSVLVAR